MNSWNSCWVWDSDVPEEVMVGDAQRYWVKNPCVLWRQKVAIVTDCLQMCLISQALTVTMFSLLAVPLGGFAASFYAMTSPPPTSLLFNMYYMHLMQVGKRFMNLCIGDKTAGIVAKHALIQLGCGLKFCILNGFHEKKWQKQKCVQIPKHSLHSFFGLFCVWY